MSEPTFNINDKFLCSFCNKPVTILKWCELTDYEGLLEVKLKTEHPVCRKLNQRKQKLTNELNNLEMRTKNKKAELTNLEYRIFQELTSN
jgi:hypothetical protein